MAGERAGSPVEGRTAATQDRFRRANEALHQRYVDLDADDAVPFICECADVRCTRVISMTMDEYREIRAHPRRFLVVPGHRLARDEQIVDERSRFVIAEKPPRGTPAA